MSRHIAETDTSSPAPRRNSAVKALRVCVIVLFAVVAFIAAALCAVTWYLTPDRLARIISTEAARNLYADVTVTNPRFTFWSTFPDLIISVDSAHISSRSLDRLPDTVKKELPDNADFLASSGKISGGVNLLKLLGGKVHLRDVSVDGMHINIVTVNDSISNYNILKEKVIHDRIDRFTLNRAVLSKPSRLTINYLPGKTKAVVDIRNASVVRQEASGNSYTVSFSGEASSDMGGVPLVHALPVSFSGKTEFSSDLSRIILSGYDISLGKADARVNIDMIFDKNIHINTFNCIIRDINAGSMLKHIPVAARYVPKYVNTDLVFGASAHLTSPYTVSSSRLPSLEARIEIPRGELPYPAKNGGTYLLKHSAINGRLIMEGKETPSSYIDIPEFEISGEGTLMTLSARISDILNDPHVMLHSKGKTDLAVAGNLIAPLKKYAISGTADNDMDLSFRLSDVQGEKLENIGFNGNISLLRYKITIPGHKAMASGDTLTLDVEGKATDISGIAADVGIKAGSMTLSAPQSSLLIKDLVADASAIIPRRQGAARRFDITINGKSAEAASGSTKVRMNNFSSSFMAAETGSKSVPKPYIKPEKWIADSLSMASISHTPEYLAVRLPRRMKEIMRKWETRLTVKASSGAILTPSLPLHNGFGNLDIAASFDSVKLNRLDLNSQDTHLSISGEVSNLRQFLTSASVAPLKMALNLDIDTVHINQLAGAYNHGLKLTRGPGASVLTVIPDTMTRTDTIALLIPRNIIADIKASAMMTRYTNLYLYDLSTALTVRDGVLSVKDLGITSDFGALKLNFAYDTSDILKTGMDMRMALSDVNVVNFFKNFHTLLLMMPQMRNIKGQLSATADARLLLFPDMYVNMPSIWADIHMQGDNLSLHQDPFIRRITRMMLIRNSDDIRLADVSIHASVHDNLMELYPFEISFDKYRLHFGGINNFNGDMYYHLGVNKSPVPFPFGINIIGKLTHPEIRFGGAGFKIKQSEEISSSVMEAKRVNLPLELKCLVREMIEKAAEADTTPASFYVY